MLTDKQLAKLMAWNAAACEVMITDSAGDPEFPDRRAHQLLRETKLELYDAFGFVEGADGLPMTSAIVGQCRKCGANLHVHSQREDGPEGLICYPRCPQSQ